MTTATKLPRAKKSGAAKGKGVGVVKAKRKPGQTTKRTPPGFKDPVLRKGLGEFMGVQETSECIGVRGQNLRFIRDLPAPHQKLGATCIWPKKEIEAFAKIYRARQADRATRTDGEI